MEDSDDINKAIDKINGWFKTAEDIQRATPFLNENLAYLKWQQKVQNDIPEKKDVLISFMDGPVQSILSMDLNNFNYSSATGSNATILTASTQTFQTIQLEGGNYQYLLSEYEIINPIEKLIENVLTVLKLIDLSMSVQFEEVKNSFSQWKANLRDNSDLAKDTSTFQEEFEGIINKLRIPKAQWGKVNIPKISWNKMVDAISKKDRQSQNSFMQQQKISEKIWQELTPILKKDKVISKIDMEFLFKRYIEHLYAVLNLIDEKIINQ
jgi:hypothetical protein